MKTYTQATGDRIAKFVVDGKQMTFADALAAAKASGSPIAPIDHTGCQRGQIGVHTCDSSSPVRLLMPEIGETEFARRGDVYAESSVHGPLCLV